MCVRRCFICDRWSVSSSSCDMCPPPHMTYIWDWLCLMCVRRCFICERWSRRKRQKFSNRQYPPPHMPYILLLIWLTMQKVIEKEQAEILKSSASQNIYCTRQLFFHILKMSAAQWWHMRTLRPFYCTAEQDILLHHRADFWEFVPAYVHTCANRQARHLGILPHRSWGGWRQSQSSSSHNRSLLPLW